MDLHAGDLCLLNLQAVHSLSLPSDNETVVFNILAQQHFFETNYSDLLLLESPVTEFFLDSLANKRRTEHHIIFHRTSSDCPYETRVQRIIQEYARDYEHHGTLVNLDYAALLIELAHTYQESVDQKTQQEMPDGDLSSVIQYIAEHYEQVSLNTVAKHFNYTPTYLSSLIKKYSGSTFSDVLQNIRFKKAVTLLEETSLSVSQIIELIGYTNRTWFTRKFKERYGITPSEYRTQLSR